MKILILIRYLIYIILSNLFQSLKVLFTSFKDYYNFNKKFNKDLKFINNLWEIKFKFQSDNNYIITEAYDDSSLYCYNLLTHAKKIQKIKKLPIIVLDKNFSFIKNIFYSHFGINKVFYLNSFFFLSLLLLKSSQ